MIKRPLSFFLVLLTTTCAAGQAHRRDPLTDAEIGKVRDAAQIPETRLKLYIEFARARLDKVQQVHSDPKATDRDFGAKLRAFRSSLTNNAQEARDDEFLIGSAIEGVDSGAKDHRDLLAEQEETFKHKKKQDRKDDSARSQ